MKNKKLLTSVLVLMMVALIAVACGNDTNSDKEEATSAVADNTEANEAAKDDKADADKADEKAEEKKDVEMKYVAAKDVQEKADDYLLLDLRKADDYKEGHIPGAVSADIDVVISGDDYETAKKTIEDATKDNDKPIVLICYSGKKYAQAGTNILDDLGADMENVHTLEGGMKQWTEDFPDKIEK